MGVYTNYIYIYTDPIITLHACSDNMSDQCYIWSDMVRCDCNKVKTFMHQKTVTAKSGNTHCTTSTQETALIVLVRVQFQWMKPLISD